MKPRQLIALAALAVSAACATDDKPSAPADVRTLIGDAACQTDAQCHTIGVGAKACGGPAAYLAWSSARTDGDKLREAAEREAQAQRQSLATSGRMSNCMVEQDPGAYCAMAAVGTASAASSTGACRLRGSLDGGRSTTTK